MSRDRRDGLSPELSAPEAAPGAAPGAVSAARAAASRKNGARSRGPVTPEGKAQSARNALKHGLCARQCLVLAEEDPGAFWALESALLAELLPAGALQGVLARQIVSAAWRLARAERLEVEIFAERRVPIVEEGGPGLQMIRDGNCSRSFETLVRYRQAALAELTRCHKALRALQGEAQAEVEGAAAGAAAPARRPSLPAKRGTAPVPARPSAPANRPTARATAIVPHPLATRQDLVATAAPPAPLPATAGPRDGLTAAIAALLAAKRTRGGAQAQSIDLRAER